MFTRPLGALLVTAVAWLTAFVAHLGLLGLPRALAAGVAFAAGFGLVGWLVVPRVRKGLDSLGFRKPSLYGLACLLLLLPAYPLGAALQALVRAVLGVPAAPAGFLMPVEFLAAGSGTESVAAALVAFVTNMLVVLAVIPIVIEWFFRGVLFAGLRERMGSWRALFLVSALSAVVLAGVREGPGEWLSVFTAACLWSVLLGLIRYATGSLLAAVLLHVGLAAQWGIATLLAGHDGPGWVPGVAPIVLCVASVAAGAWLLCRRPVQAAPRSDPSYLEVPPAPEATGGRVRFPTVGISVGGGLLVAECVVVLRNFLVSFGATGIGAELAGSLLFYVFVGALLDILVQLVLPGRFRRSPWLRALPALALALAAERYLGSFGALAIAVVLAAAVWAWTLRVPWTRPLAGAVAVAAALLYALPAKSPPPPPEVVAKPQRDAPSFIVVVLDTVRRDHCSAYGYGRPTTPTLERLAQRGVRFDRAYANSCWSVESHGSLLTGLLPHRHGATFEHERLDERIPTLASTLAAHGYEAVAFSGNPYIAPGTGMARGYSRYVDAWRPFVLRRALVAMQILARIDPSEKDKGGSTAIAGLRQWLGKRDPEVPFLAFVNLMEAHSPYRDAPHYRKFTDPALSPSELEAISRESHDAQWMGSRVPPEHHDTTIDLYDGAIASADAYLGEILDALDESTYVIVLSDHGDLVGEHGLWGHMTGLYEPLIRVPLVMAGPGLARGKVVEEPVAVVDIMPTILSLAEVPSPPTDGEDLTPSLRRSPAPLLEPPSHPSPLAERLIVAQHYRNSALLVWRQHRPAEEVASLYARKMATISLTRKRVVAEDGSDWGYDLEADPDELHPFPGPETELAAFVPPEPARQGRVELDPAQVEALRSLGYIQ